MPVIKLRQIDAKVMPRKLRLMVLVVEDLILAEATRENGGDFGDEVSLFPSERESDAETFSSHTRKQVTPASAQKGSLCEVVLWAKLRFAVKLAKGASVYGAQCWVVTGSGDFAG